MQWLDTDRQLSLRAGAEDDLVSMDTMTMISPEVLREWDPSFLAE
jgi:hypothetical protein